MSDWIVISYQTDDSIGGILPSPTPPASRKGLMLRQGFV